MNTDSIHARQLVTTIRTIDAKTPKAVLDAYTAAERVIEASHTLGAHDGDLGGAVTASLYAGNDPSTDPEVQRVVVASSIGGPGIIQAVSSIAYATFRDVAAQHADDIVKAWQKPFNDARAVLEAAHKRIGHIPLNDTGQILAKGDDVAAVWGQANTAQTTIETIASGWSSLGEFTNLVTVNRNQRALRLASIDWDTAPDLVGSKLTPWDYLLEGLTLELPTFAEYRARVLAVTEAQRAALATHDREAMDRATGRYADNGGRTWMKVG